VPIVFMNDDTRFMGKIIRVMDMPAGVALAYDSRGRAESGHYHQACTDCDRGKSFSEHLFVSVCPKPGVENTLVGSRFRGGMKNFIGFSDACRSYVSALKARAR
jgi:hypothetical protein